MNLEEFEKFISQDEHKDDIMFLVNKGILLGDFHDQTLEQWYDDCADLYTICDSKYSIFKLNISNQLDSLCFRKNLQIEDSKTNEKMREVYIDSWIKVQDFANSKDEPFVDENSQLHTETRDIIIKEVSDLIFKYKQTSLQIQNENDNIIEDFKNLVELKSVLQSDGCVLEKIKFETVKKGTQKTFTMKSERNNKLFIDRVLNFFLNKYVNEENDTKKIQKQIDIIKNTKKKLRNKLIRDIYTVFVKHDKVDFNNPKDSYKFGEERNGRYPSLKNSISLWIFDLLTFLGYLDRKISDKHKYDYCGKKDFIKNCMEDSDYLNWDLLETPKGYPYQSTIV